MKRILIADDHAIFRRGLKDILFEKFPKAIFGEAENAQQALDKIWKEEWDVVILDITMPGRSGLDVLKEIKQARPKLPVLILSMHSEDQYAVRVLKAGASGYLTKIKAAEELIEAISRVSSGGKYISYSVAEKLADDLTRDSEKPLHETLSDREYEVMKMMASGKAVGEIAMDLHLSVQTVSTHRARILKKMFMKTNAQLMKYALQHKLVE